LIAADRKLLNRLIMELKEEGGKVKLSLCLTMVHAMKTFGGVEVWLHALAALPPGRGTRYLLNRMAGVPQSRYGRDGKEKIPSARNRTPVFQPVTWSLS
jgi:hypothetical protein